MGCGGSKDDATEAEEDVPPPPPPPEQSLAERIAGAGPEQLVVVCFYKPDCEKCGLVSSFFESLVVAYPDVIFLDSNIARNNEAAEELNLKSVPTFLAFKNHREIGRYEGVNRDAIEGLVIAFNK